MVILEGSDGEGLKNTPYTFTIKNLCDSSAKYQINLETLTPSGKKLPDEYLKANLTESNVSKITTKLGSDLNTETTIEGAEIAYKLFVGELGPKEEKVFSLRLWMHSEVTALDKDSMNATYKGKISVITSYYEDKRGTLMTVNLDENNNTTGAFWDYKDKITKVVFEDELNSHKEAEYYFDVSGNQDGSVMSYLVKQELSSELIDIFFENDFGMTIDEYKNRVLQAGYTEEEFNNELNDYRNQIREEIGEPYILYIQSVGGVLAIPDSSFFFSDFTYLLEIENLHFLDTSKVINMSYMFYSCSNLTSLDLSGFDTSKVTDMSRMFDRCRTLVNLDVSNFDTSNVTTMRDMFSTAQDDSGDSLISLNLSSFDTSQVTSMRSMFFGRQNLKKLDLSSFNTSNVTDMSRMFYQCQALTILDLSSFDTSNVENMWGMFYECSSLTSVDVSSFSTSNVTDMASIFSNCFQLTNLNHFDTSNVENMWGMFYNCTNLEYLSLGLFDTSSVERCNLMFNNVPNTAIIKVKSEETKTWVLRQNRDLNVVVEI